MSSKEIDVYRTKKLSAKNTISFQNYYLIIIIINYYYLLLIIIFIKLSWLCDHAFVKRLRVYQYLVTALWLENAFVKRLRV